MKKTPGRSTAKYKSVSDKGGYRFIFYCDISGAHVCTTQELYRGDSEEEALMRAWQEEGRGRFNLCHKCGSWVMDAVYNAEVLECVECAPYETDPKYCKNCGGRIEKLAKNCPLCGKKLFYEGCVALDDSKSSV